MTVRAHLEGNTLTCHCFFPWGQFRYCHVRPMSVCGPCSIPGAGNDTHCVRSKSIVHSPSSGCCGWDKNGLSLNLSGDPTLTTKVHKPLICNPRIIGSFAYWKAAVRSPCRNTDNPPHKCVREVAAAARRTEGWRQYCGFSTLQNTAPNNHCFVLE
jgi:hypothetical protein